MTDFLQVANRAQSTLNGGITNVATSMTVVADNFPVVPFNVTLEDEIVKVTAKAALVFTIVRAQEGTTGAAHADGVAVRLHLTAAIIKQLQDHEALTTGVHGVGAGTVAKVADIAVDANLSANAQDAVTKRHDRSHAIDGTSDHAAASDITNFNVSTSAHGLAPKAVAPAAGLLNVYGIANAETAISNKAAFDNTNPAALGTAAPGTQIIAARRDHVHTDPVPTHAALTTGVHGVGASTVESASGSQSKVDTHAAVAAPHSGHINHSLATAVSDFLVASGAGVFVKKTLAEVKTLLNWAADIATHAALTATHGATGAVVGTTNSQVLTGKTLIATTNVVEEITTVASSATPAPTGGSLRNLFTVTALAVSPATFAAPSGTPANGNRLIIRILDNGVARTLAWNAIYRRMEFALPTTTVISKTLYLGFIYNSAGTGTWDMVAINQEA